MIIEELRAEIIKAQSKVSCLLFIKFHAQSNHIKGRSLDSHKCIIFYYFGEYYGKISDPKGLSWSIAVHVL